MLNNQEATTHAQSQDYDPTIPAEAKIGVVREILETEDLGKPFLQGDSWTGYYVLQPGFGAVAKFQLDLRSDPNTSARNSEEVSMHLTQLDLGDEQLYGHGLGTSLLRRAVQIGYEKAPRLTPDCPKLTTLETDRTNLIKLNTIIKVLGKDNVSTVMRGESYGQGAGRPLERMFQDFPYEEGPDGWYLMQKVCAAVDPEIIFGGSPPPGIS